MVACIEMLTVGITSLFTDSVIGSSVLVSFKYCRISVPISEEVSAKKFPISSPSNFKPSNKTAVCSLLAHLHVKYSICMVSPLFLKQSLVPYYGIY